QTGTWKTPAALACFDAAGRVLLGVAAGDRAAYVWDVAAGQRRHLLEGHAESIDAVALSADGALAVTAGGWGHLTPADIGRRGGWANSRGERRGWDAATGRPLWDREIRPGFVTPLALSPDGRLLAAAGAEGAAEGGRPRLAPFLRLLDAATGEPVR